METLRNCLEGERNVTIEELQELIDEGADFSIPAENEVCVIISPHTIERPLNTNSTIEIEEFVISRPLFHFLIFIFPLI